MTILLLSHFFIFSSRVLTCLSLTPVRLSIQIVFSTEFSSHVNRCRLLFRPNVTVDFTCMNNLFE